MKRKWRKIILGLVVIVIGLPVTFVVALVAWVSLMNKTNGTIVSSGKTRRYLLYVPKTYDPSKATPLVISMHPAASWPAAQMAISRWNELADAHGFIVVYPSGTGALGNDAWLPRGPKVWHVSPRGAQRDVSFISDLIAKLEAEYNIDPARIYADGISNGGGMSFVVSCRLSDRVAAVGAVAAAQTLPWNWCGDSRPVPMVAFHGTDDRMVPYHGGRSRDPFNPVTFPDARDWAASWARRNRWSGDSSDARITASVRRLAYTNCAENADVILYTVEGGGHSWPGGKPLPEWLVGRTTREINATSVMWAFFAQHRRGPK
ncbi:MAG: extracellular catalytic domain type 1 short-chain-length polyhydroxyalkanoate depolymerase [Gammaproteobacteria bacterium]